MEAAERQASMPMLALAAEIGVPRSTWTSL